MNKETIAYLVNCGSSSQKNYLLRVAYNQYGEVNGITTLLEVASERLNTSGSIVKAKNGNGELIFKEEKDNMPHKEACEIGLKAICQVLPLNEVELIINRAVNVGKYMSVTYLNEATEKAMEENCDRAPEHNPPALESIRIMKEKMPGVPQVLVPDSSAHVTIPKVAYNYAIPLELAEKYNLRKMGFHGSVVLNAMRELQGVCKENMQCIIAHLGNGCSITAAKNGKVKDTSMGLTPLTGTVMGTRSGDIDPTLITILASKLNTSAEEVIKLLNKKSGLLGLSGIGSDFRDLLDACIVGDDRAMLAVEIFLYRACLEISKYQMPIGGMKQLVFSGGIGENSDYVRERICENFAYLGVKLDPEKNKVRVNKCTKISSEDSAVEVFIIPADEMSEMVRQSIALKTK